MRTSLNDIRINKDLEVLHYLTYKQYCEEDSGDNVTYEDGIAYDEEGYPLITASDPDAWNELMSECDEHYHNQY